MSNEVINTVLVQAAAGRSDELGKQLQKIVETLRELPGCESYIGLYRFDRLPIGSVDFNSFPIFFDVLLVLFARSKDRSLRQLLSNKK
jgi:hypothetical protein